MQRSAKIAKKIGIVKCVMIIPGRRNKHYASFILKQGCRMASRAFIYVGDSKIFKLAVKILRKEVIIPYERKVLHKIKKFQSFD